MPAAGNGTEFVKKKKGFPHPGEKQELGRHKFSSQSDPLRCLEQIRIPKCPTMTQ